MTTILATACQAALESLGDIVGMDMACGILFCKMRPRMLEGRGGNNLNMTIVRELDPVLGWSGRSVLELNQDYIVARDAARANGTLTARNRDTWTPPQWRAAHFGIDSDKPVDHIKKMEELRDQLLADWLEEKGSALDTPRLQVHLTGLAVQAVSNLGVPQDEEMIFDGDE